MSLRLTNTLNRRTELFRPLLPGHVSIYCCGVTVYDLCHLGHARSYIVWDVLRRHLIWEGYKVTFVQNFTDIDDKILNKAAKEGCTMEKISERNIQAFHQDMDAIGIMRPDRMPRATKSLDGIRKIIKELEAKGRAYSVDGDVYFSVLKHSNYGKLSGRNLEEQQLNADGRLSNNEESHKKHPHDFALWKKAKDGEPSFPSPWGNGRPGWHIECSSMVREELGETIDIHLGGADLIFPHHENEIAQSEAATGKALSRYWLHNGMVNVDGQKMSKSLGNFTTIRSLLENGLSPMSLRLFVLQAHYRKPLDFTNDALKATSSGWKKLNTALSLGTNHSTVLNWPQSIMNQESQVNSMNNSEVEPFHEQRQQFKAAMDEDLNTSSALAILFDLSQPLRSLANRLNRGETENIKPKTLIDLYFRWKLLVELAGVLGLREEKVTNKTRSFPDEQKIKDAIAIRKAAKLTRNFKKADQIRDELKEDGIELVDKPGGKTDWIQI